MDLSSALISQFAKITKDNKNIKKETTVYGTIVTYNNKLHVKIDGSDLLTPISTTANIKNGERVTVMIKDHNATVTGNLTDPSASNNKVTNIVDQITEFEIVIADKVSTTDLDAVNARIENLIVDKASIKDLTVINAEITNLKVNKASIEDLKVTNAEIANLKVEDANIKNLVADKASIKDLTVINAEITNLKVNKASIEDLKVTNAEIANLKVEDANIKNLVADKATIKNLEAANAIINNLKATVARIDTLVGGNLSMDNMQSLHLTAQKVTIQNALIKDAMIDTVNASKINAGILNTNNVNIQSNDGSMLLKGNLQQFKDSNGNVRVQIGKDTTGTFSFGLFGPAGIGTLIDDKGIKSGALANGIIVNDMISDGTIIGGKLDINSVIREINNGTEVIKSTKIKLDEKNQTLDVAFNQMNSTVTGQGETLTTQGTDIQIAQGKIETLITDTSITEDGVTSKLKDGYSSLKSTVNGLSNKIGTIETTIKKTVKDNKPQYYESTSATALVGGNWKDTSPQWRIGIFIWQRLFFIYTDGTTAVGTAVCVQGAKGQDGTDGIPGPAGTDGTQLYTWLKYADSPTSGMNDNPLGKLYIGMAYNKTTITQSNNYADYKWSLIKGNKGDQGIPGSPGANGQPTYTWLKYSATPTTGMSDDPIGKSYMGLAYNKSTNIESTNYADYSWSLIKGEQGNTGLPGQGLISNTPQFCSHNSDAIKPAIGFVDICPNYNPGQFLWIRFKMIYENPAATKYTEPYYDASWDAKGTADNASKTVTAKVSEFTQTLDKFQLSIDDVISTANGAYTQSANALLKINNFTLSFKENSGYNLFYNGNFKNGFSNWYSNGGSIVYDSSDCPTSASHTYIMGNLTTTKYISQNIYYLNNSTDLTLSLWMKTSSTGTDGTTNAFRTAQLDITFTDNLHEYPVMQTQTKFDTWERVSMTYKCPPNKRINHIKVELYNRDTTKTVYYTDVILTKGTIEVPFSPNPNETYDGLTQIDKNGMKITQSNIDGYMQASADKFVLVKNNEELFKMNADGLYVKGRVEITSGTVPDSVLSATIKNGANNGTSAKGTLDTKASGWENALARVTDWAYGAVGGKTTINGALLETNTVIAEKIAIGDFSNYVSDPSFENNIYINNSGWDIPQDAYRTGNKCLRATTDVGSYGVYCISKKISVRNGDKFYVEWWQYRTSACTTPFNVDICVYNNDDTVNVYDIAGNYIPPINETTNTWNKYSYEGTVNTDGYALIYVKNRSDAQNTGTIMFDDITVKKMSTGELIVDGAIDGKTIRGTTIIGGLIKSINTNTQGSPVFSLGQDGKIIGADIDCLNIVSDGEVSTDVLNVSTINNPLYPKVMIDDAQVYISPGMADTLYATEFIDGGFYRSFSDLEDLAPRNLNGYGLRVRMMSDHTENIMYDTFSNGTLTIELNGFTLNGYILFMGYGLSSQVYGGIVGSNTLGTIAPYSGYNKLGYRYAVVAIQSQLTIRNARILKSTVTDIESGCILCDARTTGYISNVVAVNEPNLLLRCHAGSYVYLAKSSGITTNFPVHAVSGSIITVNNTNQCGRKGSTSHTYTTNNGQVFANGVTWDTAAQSGGGSSSGGSTTTKTKTINATSADTWRSSVYNSWKKDGTVRQGDYGYGDCNGFWFFGSTLASYLAKNVTKVTIKISRQSGGTSSAISHTLIGHSYTVRPSGGPSYGSVLKTFSLAVGSSITLTLTATEIANLKNYKGIGLKSAYTSSLYSVCSGGCSITITYTE